MKKCFSNNKGISLITLVITIIVIIILAAIVLFTSLMTVDNANYATFVSEYDEINSGTQAKLKSNILNGKSEEERNAGFKKVKIENAPGSFMSVSDGAIEGYLVDLDTIKVTGTKTGKGEVINETVTFGKDDVYIYDDEGKVYYAKGYSDGEGQPKYKLDEELNLAQKPTIDSVDFTLSADKTTATIKVIARPGNSGELRVTADGKTAIKTGDNTYEIEVNKNGKILVIVKEIGGSSESQEIEIIGVEKPKCFLTYDANGGSNAPASEEFEEGKLVTISLTEPTRSGYKFLGWSELKGAATAVYRAGGTYSKGVSTTLYAVWRSTTLEEIPTVIMESYVYNQTPSKPKISANPGNGTVTYYYATSSTSDGTKWSNSVKLDAGTYYMYAKITNMKDYDDVQTSKKSFEVTRAKGSISWEKSAIKTTIGDGAFVNTLKRTEDSAEVTYSSTQEDVATIDINGNVTIKGVGETMIKATVANSKNYIYENATASYTLTVNKASIVGAKVLMDGYTYEGTLIPPTIDGNTSGGIVTYYYYSVNESNANRKVWSGITSTSLNAGTYYIYAEIAGTDRYESFTTLAIQFTIAKSNTGSINFKQTEITKETIDKSFVNTLTKTGDGNVKYESSDQNVATVNETTGEVTIKGAGGATITATVADGINYAYETKTASYTLTVNKASASINYETTKVTKQLTDGAFRNELINTGDGTVSYSSSSTNVATVDSTTGEIEMLGTGTTIITAKVEDSAKYTYETKEVSYKLIVVIHSVANGPMLGTGMKAVYWDSSGEEQITDSFVLAETDEETIYNGTLYNYYQYEYDFDDDMYSERKDTYGIDWAKQPRWANAITSGDGSYWVWIPRYAYKITYYSDEARTTVSTDKEKQGYIDVIFLKGTSDDEYIDKNGVTHTGLPRGYKVHPAFQALTSGEIASGDNPLGKWDEKLTGIWVAKFEASNENGNVVSKPSVTSWRSITVSDIYQNCLNMNTTLNTHQMKNSEWGAVAYLTYSVYGRNGNELSVNQCKSYYTGAGPSADGIYGSSTYEYSEDTFNSTYGWKTERGKLASTTGNVYGVYDMSGGVWERTASYLKNGSTNLSYIRFKPSKRNYIKI